MDKLNTLVMQPCDDKYERLSQLLARIKNTPSVKQAIQDGEYDVDDFDEEVMDQLETGEVEFGVLMIDDLDDDVRKEIQALQK
jgi:hypothetical protein